MGTEDHPVVENRFWSLTVTNPEIHEAVGAPVSGLVDEQAGGVVAYVLDGEGRSQRLVDVLNAAAELDPNAQDAAGRVGRLLKDLT